MQILGLSKKANKVLDAIQTGQQTPLHISRTTGISRTAVYAILQNLKGRGLIRTRIAQGRKHWEIVSIPEMEEILYETKRRLFRIPEGSKELYGRSDAMIIVHRGAPAIKQRVFQLFQENKNERFYALQGDAAAIGWDHLFSVPETNQLNTLIKKNNIVVESVIPQGWFERQFDKLGKEWAHNFEGRATRAQTIPPEYFSHGGQLWILKDQLFLAAFKEETLIEIRHSAIQSMILALFTFMADHAKVIDANAILRGLMTNKSIRLRRSEGTLDPESRL